MRFAHSISLLALLIVSIQAAEPDAAPQYKGNGFTITPLEGSSDAIPHQALMMFLPASEGFAPNVNVQIQPYADSMKEYVALSRKQFESAGVNIMDEQTTPNSVVWEYTGSLNGKKVHWYAIAIKKKDKVYLATATALVSQWPSVSERLKACVNSFQLDLSKPVLPSTPEQPRKAVP